MQITNCKLSKRVQKKLLEFFVLQVTTRSAADILGIQPNSAILFYRKIHMVISHYLALVVDEVFEGPVELDESYFGGRRKGRRGRGSAGKVVVFGILKRNGRVYTVVVDLFYNQTLTLPGGGPKWYLWVARDTIKKRTIIEHMTTRCD